MTKLIIGMYDSEVEAINAVDSYELKGHEAKNITILTKSSLVENELLKDTNVDVENTNSKNIESDTFMEKVKNIFTDHKDFKDDTLNALIDYGLTKEQATECITSINIGKIVVIADDTLKMGHA